MRIRSNNTIPLIILRYYLSRSLHVAAITTTSSTICPTPSRLLMPQDEWSHLRNQLRMSDYRAYFG